MFNKVVESCRFLLNNFHGARDCKDYLDSRLNEKSQELFEFGYFPNSDNLKALTSIVGEDVLKEEELLYFKEIEDSLYPRSIPVPHFKDHPLIMPFKDSYGKIVGLVGRSLLSDTERKIKNISKYKNTAESSAFKKGHLLFGLYENKQSILEKDLVYVVEGQFDVIKSIEKGFTNIVALGTSGMTPYQFSLISRYTDNIILLLDNDEPGEKGRRNIIDKFGKYANIQNFYLPTPYKDIDEFLCKNSYEDLSFIIKE